MIDLPDVLELHVLQEDIDKAKESCPNLCRTCIVGRALNRQFPEYVGEAYNTEVGFYKDQIAGQIFKCYKRYSMDSVGREVVDAFNNYPCSPLEVEPCTIVLTAKNG
jgi:hypothetical protein